MHNVYMYCNLLLHFIKWSNVSRKVCVFRV